MIQGKYALIPSLESVQITYVPYRTRIYSVRGEFTLDILLCFLVHVCLVVFPSLIGRRQFQKNRAFEHDHLSLGDGNLILGL